MAVDVVMDAVMAVVVDATVIVHGTLAEQATASAAVDATVVEDAAPCSRPICRRSAIC